MIMKPTALIYSSHNRCEYIHRHWLVERALESHHNKTIFYIPLSMGRYDQQHFSWGTFRWYFDRFRQWGLEARTFFWDENMSDQDVENFFQMTRDSEVVILGGGSSYLGFERYNGMGARYNGDHDLFNKLLHDRQANGMLTAGFSAGAIQLGDVCEHDEYHKCYGLIYNVTTRLHHEWGGEEGLRDMARRFTHCLCFGLPNDSGIASNQGVLRSGCRWQVLQFIIDSSWDLEQDGFHIKTRQGMKIEHFYEDGRKWVFNGGDVLVRVTSPDYQFQGIWIIPAGGGDIYDYWTQQPTGYRDYKHILASH
ncbi:hypothetical protein ACFL27_00255 [candidate division CSSED10-310 bacterium]|uniref:Cyanophycinase n=1 Tax=candidate division CSSED10-310 bacterium TaxID=2855610 RepID=A0ABV6YQY1_UNCC1